MDLRTTWVLESVGSPTPACHSGDAHGRTAPPSGLAGVLEAPPPWRQCPSGALTWLYNLPEQTSPRPLPHQGKEVKRKGDIRNILNIQH